LFAFNINNIRARQTDHVRVSVNKASTLEQVRQPGGAFSRGKLMKAVELLDSRDLVSVAGDLNIFPEPLFDPANLCMQALFYLLSGVIS
jgi:hypothetical protein